MSKANPLWGCDRLPIHYRDTLAHGQACSKNTLASGRTSPLRGCPRTFLGRAPFVLCGWQQPKPRCCSLLRFLWLSFEKKLIENRMSVSKLSLLPFGSFRSWFFTFICTLSRAKTVEYEEEWVLSRYWLECRLCRHPLGKISPKMTAWSRDHIPFHLNCFLNYHGSQVKSWGPRLFFKISTFVCKCYVSQSFQRVSKIFLSLIIIF